MSLNIEYGEVARERKINLYRKIAKSPRHSMILGRFQKIGYMPVEALQDHYLRTAETIEKGYAQLQARLRKAA